MIPGMQMEKNTCSDSDSEVQEAFYREKAERRAREQAEEERHAEAVKEMREREEANKDVEQVLQALVYKEELEQIIEFLSSIDSKRPEEFQERLRSSETLREKAKELWASADKEKTQEALKYWHGAVHFLDFTSAQIKEMSEEDRLLVFDPLAKVLSNISIAYHRLRDAQDAIRCANLAMYVVGKLPYASSKALREKIYIRRALARGDIRNFNGALDDANHVLTLTTGHEEATCIARNSQIALRRESGPKEKRWKGPLNKPIPKKNLPKTDSSLLYWRILTVGALLLLFFMLWRYMAAAPVVDDKSAEL